MNNHAECSFRGIEKDTNEEHATQTAGPETVSPRSARKAGKSTTSRDWKNVCMSMGFAESSNARDWGFYKLRLKKD